MEKMHSDRNAWTFLASTDTKVQLRIVMQQPLLPGQLHCSIRLREEIAFQQFVFDW
jgi:hypothetical protein